MNEADNARCTDWLGAGESVWRIYALCIDEMTFTESLYYYRHLSSSRFQGACLDCREDELLLDAVGCLDAPL